jgi:transglutaminase-like putative cysteine protease
VKPASDSGDCSLDASQWMTTKAFPRGSATLGYNAKSVVLLVLGMALFAGIVALTLETVTGAFESPGTPLLKSETFRTSETPFRGWSTLQVAALVMFALAVMAFGAFTLIIRNRLAGIASAASLLVLLGLVLFTPIGRYGAGGLQKVDAAAPNNRFIALESGVLYDTQGKLPFGAVEQFRDRFPVDGPQDIRPDFDIKADLRASRVSAAVPLFKISGAGQGTYLRQSVLDEYRNGVWSHNPIGEYDPTTGSAVALRVPANTGRDSGDTVSVRVIPITQMPPGGIITASNIRKMDFPDPLLYSHEQTAFFSPNSHALAYSFESMPQNLSADDLTGAQVFYTQTSADQSEAVSSKVRELAEEVAEGLDESPFLQIKALERHLRSGFEYDPSPEPAPDGTDPVEWFLFESKSGTALHFNSALALMARSLGIQTRLVAGWLAGNSDGQQTIYGDMAHAWTEARLVMNGRAFWLEFDASTDDGPRERVGGVEPPAPRVQVISATPSPDANSGGGLPGIGDLSVGSATEDPSGLSQSPDGLPPPDLEPFIGPSELPGTAGEFDPTLGQIAGLPGAEGLEGRIPGDPASLGELPGAPGSLGDIGGDPTGAASEGAGDPSEEGSGDGSGTGGNGSSAVQLENGLQMDLDQGGISGVSLGVKGPVQLTDQPVFQLTGASGISKLRLVTGETYTGSSWLPAEMNSSFPADSGQPLPFPGFRTATDYIFTTVTATPILPMGPGPVPVSIYTIGVSGLHGSLFDPNSLSVGVTIPIDSGYSWRAATPVIRPKVLRTKRTAVLSNALLQLPYIPPQRVLDLAVQITQGKDNDYDKLEAIRQHLLQNYAYDLDNAAAPAGWDAVDFFLFSDQRGICTTFSSAMVVMARPLGIPARVVAGWSVSPVNLSQEVRTSQAHQWVEVPFEDVGWVTFDPTPGGAPTRTAFPEANAALPDVDIESDESTGTAETETDEPIQGEGSEEGLTDGQQGEGIEGSGTGGTGGSGTDTEGGEAGEAGGGAGGTGGTGEGGAGGGGGSGGSGGSGSITPLENGMSLDVAAGILVGANAGLPPLGTTGQAGRPANIPVLQVSGALNTRYLRQGVSIDYQGGNWSYSPEQDLIREYVFPPDDVAADINLARSAALGPSDAYYLGSPQVGTPTAVEITVTPLLSVGNRSPLPTSLYLSNISLPGLVDAATNIFTTALGLKANDVYGWKANSYGFDATTLTAAKPVQDPRYFQLPDGLPPRIRELALHVTAEAASPYEKARALEIFLKTQYTYAFIQDDPTYVPMPSGRDPVDWFLFDHPVGTCGNFSSSFVLMARSIGLPARIVTGWAIAPIVQKQIVKTGQAHQWAEVALEATAAGGAPDRVPEASSQADEDEFKDDFDRSGDAGGEGTPAQPPRLEETITDITSMSSSRVLKGTQVLVRGTVTDSRGQPIDGMDVEIRLSETKEEEGIKMSQGRAANGAFAITMVIGPDTPAGAYQVLAHNLEMTTGNVRFTDSWSDPPIVVYTPTKITIEPLPPTIYASKPVTIGGMLTELVGDSPSAAQACQCNRTVLG